MLSVLLRFVLPIVMIVFFSVAASATEGKDRDRIQRDTSLDYGVVTIGLAKRDSIRLNGYSGGGEFRVIPGGQPGMPFFVQQPYRFRIVNGSVNVVVDYWPLSVGRSTRVLTLARVPAILPVNDTIWITLRGEGRSLTRSVDIDFGTWITGDTTSSWRWMEPREGWGPDIKWRIEEQDLGRGFRVMSGSSPVRENDALGLRVGYSPLVEGDYSGRALMIRSWNTAVLDTFIVNVKGSAFRQKIQDATMRFDSDSVMIGKVILDSAFIKLKPAPTRRYGYAVNSTVSPPTGPVVATLVAPIGLSLDTTVIVKFVCMPTTMANFNQSFILRRSNEEGIVVDSTIINATTQVVPRPVSLSLRLGPETTSVRTGDTVTLVLKARTNDPIDEPVRYSSIAATLKYNATVLVPLDETGEGGRVAIGATAGYTFRKNNAGIIIDGPETDVMKIRFVAVLGDDDNTAITPDDIVMHLAGTNDDRRFRTNPVHVKLTDVWDYLSGRRLVNTLRGGLQISVEPNPVAASSTITIPVLPAAAGSLQIVTPVGQVVADLTDDVRAGIRTFTVMSGTGSRLALSPGTYYARLLVRDDRGATVSSVVRMFVVQ
ncbi:MAG: hypothetical protein J0I17_05335 ['Candidatus Kapabacteria' thiocyanatum]|nr:hypothetical protein ['Candidatus Kapabacteria' thiocyanatum]